MKRIQVKHRYNDMSIGVNLAPLQNRQQNLLVFPPAGWNQGKQARVDEGFPTWMQKIQSSGSEVKTNVFSRKLGYIQTRLKAISRYHYHSHKPDRKN